MEANAPSGGGGGGGGAQLRAVDALSDEQYATILRNPAVPTIMFTETRQPTAGHIYVEVRKAGCRRPRVDGLEWEQSSTAASRITLLADGEARLVRYWNKQRMPKANAATLLVRHLRCGWTAWIDRT